MTSRDELARQLITKLGAWTWSDTPKKVQDALIESELRVQELREALRIAAEESWAVKNGLMEIRDSAELDPIKDEWISAKISQWQAGAGLSEEKP